MGNIKYILSRLSKMDYKAMLNKINEVHKKTKKSRISIFLDMEECARKYGAGYMDYDLFEMYNLTDEQRDTYITRGRNNNLISKYNDKAYFHIFENKDEFNKMFNEYLKRDWLKIADSSKEQILEFISKHNTFMAKPIDGGCGKGIEKINSKNYNSSDELYDYLKNNHTNSILEEVIQQNEKVSSIYPDAINTARVVTILKDNKTNVICAYFRIGNGSFVDNFNSGGMVAPIDVKTGIVSDKAIDKNKNLYEVHPATGDAIKGFQFPDWDKAIKMCKEAAKVVPQMAYIGWDVGFSKKGPVFVEANEFPGHDIYQLPEHTPNKIGMMSKFINI